MLARKDYEAIARIINKLGNADGNIDKSELVGELSDYFEKENPNFNRDLFFKACYKSEED